MDLLPILLVVELVVLGLAMWIGNVMSKRLVQLRTELTQLHQRVDQLEMEVEP